MPAQIRKLNTKGMRCPIPILRATKEIKRMDSGDILEVTATDGQAPRDFVDYCEETGHKLLKSEEIDDYYLIVIEKSETP